MPAVLQRLTRVSIVCLTMSALSGCVEIVIAAECSWVKAIYLASQDVVTRATEDKIIAHNKKVAELCRDK